MRLVGLGRTSNGTGGLAQTSDRSKANLILRGVRAIGGNPDA
jgi:hypothetical protein